MEEQVTERMIIRGSPEDCYQALVAFERYPEWAADIKSVTVDQRDDQGRASEVTFRAAAFGRSTSYTLHYDYADAPSRLSWKLVKGDIMRACEGSYQFAPSGSSSGATDVVYELSIELVVPLPGFVKRRAEVRILNTVKELKARAEA